jgi:cytoskeletal protein RodZ
MAEIPVTKKSSSSWWIWLIGLLVLAAIIWFLYQTFTDDRASAPATTAPSTATAPAAPTSTAPATSPQTDAAPATSAAPASTGETITDTGAYASAGDKLSLVGRRAELTDARVARVVGPKAFTVVSGSDEMVVMVDDDLSKGVGTQGQIDKGNVLNVKGTFRRLTAEEISDVSDNRFRDLTEQERETLRKTQVYLHATEFSKIS